MGRARELLSDPPLWNAEELEALGAARDGFVPGGRHLLEPAGGALSLSAAVCGQRAQALTPGLGQLGATIININHSNSKCTELGRGEHSPTPPRVPVWDVLQGARGLN